MENGIQQGVVVQMVHHVPLVLVVLQVQLVLVVLQDLRVHQVLQVQEVHRDLMVILMVVELQQRQDLQVHQGH